MQGEDGTFLQNIGQLVTLTICVRNFTSIASQKTEFVADIAEHHIYW
jgi:hypothetical protein